MTMVHPAASRIAATICVVLAATISGAHAQESAFDGDSRAAIRLISGQGETPDVKAGLEMRLAPGWKTYWRYPGDAGVPPRFDFSLSDNLASATVLWPAPQRFADSEGETIGYTSRVIFPLRVTAIDPAKPVTLRVKADYAICEKLCIPYDGKAEVTLAPKQSASAALVDAQKLVPAKQKLAADGALSVIAIKRDDSATPPKIIADVRGGGVTLFAEGPGADWALPVPREIPGAPAGMQRFSFALDGLPPGASAKGATLLLTAVSGTRAIETPITLD